MNLFVESLRYQFLQILLLFSPHLKSPNPLLLSLLSLFSSFLVFSSFSFIFYFSILFLLISSLFLSFSLSLFTSAILTFSALVSTVLHIFWIPHHLYLFCPPVNFRIVANKPWHSQNQTLFLTTNYINFCPLPMFLVINIHLYCILNKFLLVKGTIHILNIYQSFYLFQLQPLLSCKL